MPPSTNGYPLVNKHSYGKWPIYSWFPHKKLWFSIVMLVYQRVNSSCTSSRMLWVNPSIKGACCMILGFASEAACRNHAVTIFPCPNSGARNQPFLHEDFSLPRTSPLWPQQLSKKRRRALTRRTFRRSRTHRRCLQTIGTRQFQ